MILLVDFHVYLWLLLSKKPRLKGSSAKKGTLTENFLGADAPFAPPAPEDLHIIDVSCSEKTLFKKTQIDKRHIDKEKIQGSDERS